MFIIYVTYIFFLNKENNLEHILKFFLGISCNLGSFKGTYTSARENFAREGHSEIKSKGTNQRKCTLGNFTRYAADGTVLCYLFQILSNDI